MLPVFFTAGAQADLDSALAWYGTHAPEIAPQFRGALRAVVGRISENPRQFPASPHETRRALLRRFPYQVIFCETSSAAYVVAIFHASREPKTWQTRLS